MTKKPVRAPKVKTYQNDVKKDLENDQEHLWKRIEEAKRPPTRPPAREVGIGGIPLIEIGISATGIDTRYNYRLAERKRDFNDSLYYMLRTLRDAITNNKTLSVDQKTQLRNTRDTFEVSIDQLKKYLRTEEDLDLIEATIAAAYEIGAFGGRHPVEGRIRTAPAIEKRKERTTRRRMTVDAILLPIVAEHRDWRDTRIAEKAKKTLKKQRLKVGDRYLRGRIAHLKKVGTTEQCCQESR